MTEVKEIPSYTTVSTVVVIDGMGYGYWESNKLMPLWESDFGSTHGIGQLGNMDKEEAKGKYPNARIRTIENSGLKKYVVNAIIQFRKNAG